MLGMKVWGLRSMSGNQVLCTCTIFALPTAAYEKRRQQGGFRIDF
jgi:hypothetical protein